MSELINIVNCLKASLNIDAIVCNSVVSGLFEDLNEFKPHPLVKITKKCPIGKLEGLDIIIDGALPDTDLKLYDKNGNVLLDMNTQNIL